MYICLDGVSGERYLGVGWAVTCIYVANKLFRQAPSLAREFSTRLHTTNKDLASDVLTHTQRIGRPLHFRNNPTESINSSVVTPAPLKQFDLCLLC